ncbi:MAG TPA: D-erythronate dehydrogenase [Vicinamibacterales bacterium]|nr:D-erythronate dehydrogenase [Vicinamibacterales bacterium]
MNVLITGGAGFLGRRLADALLQRGALCGPDGRPQSIDRITLADVAASSSSADPRIVSMTGDLADDAFLAEAAGSRSDSIFHLAAVVSGMAEADFDLGMRVNVDASRALLDVCRRLGGSPRLVFASSVAVYGGELPAVVQDSTAILPQSSYGTEKAIVELLINDYSRRGFIDGRVLRLPTVSVRPGRPNAAASSFASGIIREPLNGEAAVCPVDPSTRLWLVSPATAIDCFIALHDVPAARLGPNRIVNGPGLSVSVAGMIASLERLAGPSVTARIAFQRDPRIEHIVATWPGAWDDSRARSLGLPGDDSFDAIVRRYIEDAALKIS